MAQTQTTKVALVTRGRDLTTQLANVGDALSGWRDAFVDRGLRANGTNPLADEDVAALGLTAAEVQELITFVQDFKQFLTVERRAVISRLRNDF